MAGSDTTNAKLARLGTGYDKGETMHIILEGEDLYTILAHVTGRSRRYVGDHLPPPTARFYEQVSAEITGYDDLRKAMIECRKRGDYISNWFAISLIMKEHKQVSFKNILYGPLQKALQSYFHHAHDEIVLIRKYYNGHYHWHFKKHRSQNTVSSLLYFIRHYCVGNMKHVWGELETLAQNQQKKQKRKKQRKKYHQENYREQRIYSLSDLVKFPIQYKGKYGARQQAKYLARKKEARKSTLKGNLGLVMSTFDTKRRRGRLRRRNRRNLKLGRTRSNHDKYGTWEDYHVQDSDYDEPTQEELLRASFTPVKEALLLANSTTFDPYSFFDENEYEMEDRKSVV